MIDEDILARYHAKVKKDCVKPDVLWLSDGTLRAASSPLQMSIYILPYNGGAIKHNRVKNPMKKPSPRRG
jgi:hypothetical protein